MSSGALRVVTRPGDALGFRLAGVRVDEVSPGAESAALLALLADPGNAVLAVESDVLAALPAHESERAMRRARPVVIPFHLPRRPAEARAVASDYVAALLRRAIGYRVKLEARR
jgi:V/A-type H+-transporting ATPase subunit F